jgi:hypothetical protein
VVDTILNTADSTGGTHQIGELSTNTYTSADDVRDSQFWKILNYRKTFTFTNTDHHPVHLYLYEYISKKNRAFSETSLELLCAHDFEDAFDYESATGSNSATAVSGSAQMASASTAMNMVQHVPPHTLPAFRKKWKCSHKAQVVLQPGDTATYVLRAKKNIRFDYKDIISKDSSTYGGTIDDTLAVRGLGKVLMFAIRGPLGHGTSSKADVGWMEANIARSERVQCTVIPMELVKRIRYTNIKTDDLTAVTLEGPTDQNHTAENA